MIQDLMYLAFRSVLMIAFTLSMVSLTAHGKFHQAHSADVLFERNDEIGENIKIEDLVKQIVGNKDQAELEYSVIFSRAIDIANARMANGQPPGCIVIPPGIFHLNRGPLPTFRGNGCIIGAGENQTVLRLGTEFEGDLFSWSEAWLASSYPMSGSTADASSAAGPIAEGFTAIGDRSGSGRQNCLTFYDRNDFALVDNVSCMYFRGRALFIGGTKYLHRAYMRESRIKALRVWYSGDDVIPAVEINSAGDGDATNEIVGGPWDIYGPYGPGLTIQNTSGTTRVGGISIAPLRIEGIEGKRISSDLLVIGNNVAEINLLDTHLIDPYPGYSAIKITASEARFAPYFIDIRGGIGGGLAEGQGLEVEYGRNMHFAFKDIHTKGANVRFRSTAGEQNIIEGLGNEKSWTYLIAGPNGPIVDDGPWPGCRLCKAR